MAILHTSRENLLVQALATFNAALTFGTDAPPAEPLLFATVDENGATYPDRRDAE